MPAPLWRRRQRGLSRFAVHGSGFLYSDRMRAPIRPVRDTWPAPLEKRLARFFRLNPRVILDEGVTSAAFREAMTSIYVGGTIKITGSDRHPETGRLLMDTVDLTNATIVDIGASDGSTSVDLIEQIGSFGRYVIADLYISLRATEVGSHTVMFDDTGTCVLVVGNRLMAWPELSAPVRLAYAPLIAKARKQLGSAREVLLLNPSARGLIREDERVEFRKHDVFGPWDGDKPDVIKVANLLRRLYFSDEDLLRALAALHANLPEGGHLFLVDNPRILNTPPRAGIFRRDGDRFTEVARLGEPEIADLAARVGD